MEIEQACRGRGKGALERGRHEAPRCEQTPVHRYGARLTEFILLGNVALRAGKRLTWDAVGMKATNAPEADESLRETYRPGWEPPA